MVATRLLEVTNKGTEWARGTPSRPERTASATAAAGTPAHSHHPNASSASASTPPHPLYDTNAQQYPHQEQTSSYWSYATDSLRSAADSTYSTLTGILSSLVYSDRNSGNDPNHSSTSYFSSIRRSLTAASPTSMENNPSSGTQGAFAPRTSPTDPMLIRRLESAGSNRSASSRQQYSQHSASASTSRGGRFHAKDIAWIWKNPYSSVRGRQQNERPSSVAAVRSLLALVPVEESNAITGDTISDDSEFPPWLEPHSEKQPDDQDDDEEKRENQDCHAASSPTIHHKNVTTRTKDATTKLQQQHPDSPSMDESWRDQPLHHDAAYYYHPHHGKSIHQPHPNISTRTSVSPPETASQLAEGTIRALRDLALDEAVELQEALRYWNSRWEQPLLSWLEAGPWGESISICLQC